MAGFIVGSTVKLYVTVRDPLTKHNVDPTSVQMVSFHKSGSSTELPYSAFIRNGTGVYVATLSTIGFSPGTYDVLTRISGANGVALLDDTFVVSDQ